MHCLRNKLFSLHGLWLKWFLVDITSNIFKNSINIFYPHLFVGGLKSYLYYLFVAIVVSYTYSYIYELYSRWLIRDRNYLFFLSTWDHPGFFGGVRVPHLFSFFMLSYYVSLRSEFCIKTMFDSSLPQLFVGGFMSYLCYMFVCA